MDITPTNDTGLLLKEGDAAKLLGISKPILARLRKMGIGPDHVKIGRNYFYEQDALRSWIKKKSSPAQLPKGQQGQLIDQFLGLPKSELENSWWEQCNAEIWVAEVDNGTICIGIDLPNGSAISIRNAVFSKDEKTLVGEGQVEILAHFGVAR